MDISVQDRDEAAAPARGERLCSRPIDLVYLARFTLGNRALEREVLELFATQAPLYLAQLRTAADDRAWHMAAHTLKGSASAVGAWKAAAAAEAAEACTGADSVARRAAAIARLEPLLAEARSYIHTLFRS